MPEARRLSRLTVGWALLADTIPIYPLYALLFADAGLSGARISTLFLVWSCVAIVAEVPSGALADRYSRRAALVASGVLQAAGYVLWITVPSYAAFAAGFALWGIGGAFASGALEALLYDGMAAMGAEEEYPRVYGRVTAVGLLSQLPAAAAATILFATGGYRLAGWVSVACCLGAAAVATRLPDVRTKAVFSEGDEDGDRGSEPGYFGVLRSGVAAAARRPALRAAVVAVAILGALDGLEEYFPLLAQEWGVATSAVPIAVLAIPLVGAAGAALGGAASQLHPRRLGVLLAAAVAVFGGAAVLSRPVGVAGIALAYGIYRLVLVVTDARLQSRIEGEARATVTSVASVATELTTVVLYVAWALDRPVLVAALALAMAAALPWLLRPDAARRPQGSAAPLAVPASSGPPPTPVSDRE